MVRLIAFTLCDKHGLVQWDGSITCKKCGRFYTHDGMAKRLKSNLFNCQCGVLLIDNKAAKSSESKDSSMPACLECLKERKKSNDFLCGDEDSTF